MCSIHKDKAVSAELMTLSGGWGGRGQGLGLLACVTGRVHGEAEVRTEAGVGFDWNGMECCVVLFWCIAVVVWPVEAKEGDWRLGLCGSHAVLRLLRALSARELLPGSSHAAGVSP